MTRREILEAELAAMGDGDVPEGCEWICRCRMPDGTIETTYWITEDGAAEMEAEAERTGGLCVVFNASR